MLVVLVVLVVESTPVGCSVAAGDYPLRVRLDDGADVDPVGDADYIELDLGSVTLP